MHAGNGGAFNNMHQMIRLGRRYKGLFGPRLSERMRKKCPLNRKTMTPSGQKSV